MGNFNSAVITKKGQALMAKVVAGTTKLNFTRIAVSDSELSNDLASLTGIGTIRQSQAVSYVERQNNSYVKVGTSFVNTSLASGYYVRNIGFFCMLQIHKREKFFIVFQWQMRAKKQQNGCLLLMGLDHPAC